MKLGMKKMVGVLALSAVCAIGMNGEAKAANNTQATAKTLKANTTYTCSNPTDSPCWYKVNMTDSGYFALKFDDLQGDTNGFGYWDVSVWMGNRLMMDSETVYVSDTLFISPKYGCEKDSKVYIKVDANGFDDRQDYQMTLLNKAASDWESENNSQKKDADKVKIGKVYHANFDESDSLDWFTTTIEKSGYFSVAVKKTKEEADTYNSLGMTIYADGKVVYDELIGDLSNKSYFKSSKIGVKKGQKVYVRFAGDMMEKGSEYQFMIQNSADANFELEGNNTKKTANTLILGKKMTGTYGTTMDVDWYAYKVKKTGTYKVYAGWLDSNENRRTQDLDVYVGSKRVEHLFYDSDYMRKIVTIKAKAGQTIYVTGTLSPGTLVNEKMCYGVKITK